uniref:Mur ligase central domain-containing protein n=1 Tax=Oryza meridionalis TaxID=40149 RepID=A0A0E0FE42_9ORYZ
MLPRFPVSLLRSRSLLRGSARRGLVTAMAGGRGGAGGGEDGQLGEFYEYMERLRNYERSGVPRGAGTDSDDGFDLGRMRRLLRRLGDPHTHFPAVHIAGTKGKGSTAAFLSNIMREQGYNVGCYTSPHLLTIRERISVGQSGGPVSAELLRDLFGHAKEAIGQSIESEDGALTHFEVFTALSYLLFSQENVDIAVVEFIELQDVKLQLLGDHQRQNAVTACCTALCLRELAHTEASAKALSDVIKTVQPRGPLALVVGMANDKEHLAFAEQLVSGPRPDVVLLTEASIAGGRSRSMPASSLKEIWMAAAQSQGISYYSDIGTITGVEAPIIASRPTGSRSLSSDKPMLIGCCTPFSSDLIRVASRLLQSQEDGDTGLICVTGSLHMVSSVLGQLRQ